MAKSTKSAYDSLIEVLGLTKEDGEETSAFLKRLVIAANAMPDEDWDKLNKAAQEWFNQQSPIATAANEAGVEPVFTEPDGMTPPPEGTIVPREVKKAGRKPKEPKEPKEPKVRAEPAADVVRRLICENVEITLDDLMKKLEECGVDMMRSSAQVVHLNTVRAFKTLIDKTKEIKNKAGEVLVKVD